MINENNFITRKVDNTIVIYLTAAGEEHYKDVLETYKSRTIRGNIFREYDTLFRDDKTELYIIGYIQRVGDDVFLFNHTRHLIGTVDDEIENMFKYINLERMLYTRQFMSRDELFYTLSENELKVYNKITEIIKSSLDDAGDDSHVIMDATEWFTDTGITYQVLDVLMTIKGYFYEYEFGSCKTTIKTPRFKEK